MKRWTLVLVGVIAASIAITLLVTGGDEQIARSVAPQVPIAQSNSDLADESVELVDQSEADVAETEYPVGESTDKRKPVELDGLFVGVVVDSADKPIAGAVLSWTSIPHGLLDLGATAQGVNGFVASNSKQVFSDSNGRFRFTESPLLESPLGSVIWMTHTQFEARSLVLSGESNEWIQSAHHELKAVASQSATVVDSAERGVDGALIEQFALTNEVGEVGQNLNERLVWLLHRSTTTDGSGRALLQVFPGRQQVSAARDDQRSAPWIGVAREPISLLLESTITARGLIERKADIEDGLELTVQCHVQLGARVIELASLVSTTSDWGPVELPYYPEAEYRFRLDALGVVAKEVFAYPKGAGEQPNVDFVAEYGHVVWFYVIDEQGNMLKEAEATFAWDMNGRRVEQVAQNHPEYEGYITTSGIPTTVLHAQFRCTGFESKWMTPLSVPQPETNSLEVVLAKGGSVRGICLLDGMPVEDFEIAVWPTLLSGGASVHHFEGRTDGTFEIGGVRLTDTSLAASVPGELVSSVERISIDEFDSKQVRLNLYAGNIGVGQVVDAEHGLPLNTATVRATYSADGTVSAVAGLPRQVDSLGNFHLSGLQSGDGLLQVSAPGYASVDVPFYGEPGKDADLGVIHLSPRGSLTIKINVADEVDVTQLRAIVGGGVAFLGELNPNAEGVVRFDSVASGLYTCDIYFADDSVHSKDFYLDPAKDDWSVEIDAKGDCVLNIEVNAENDEPLPKGLMFIASRRHSDGWVAAVLRDLDETGRYSMRNTPAGNYQVLVRGSVSPFTVYGEQQLQLNPGDNATVQFQLGDKDQRFRVVDGEGNSIPGASVQVSDPNVRQVWEGVNQSDTKGEFTVKGYTGSQILVHMNHPDHGISLGVQVDLDDSEEVIELVLDGSIDVVFELHDATGPVVGAQTRIADYTFTRSLINDATDEMGRVMWENLTATPHQFILQDPNYWLINRTFVPEPGSGPIVMEASRLCDLTIEIVTNGLPRPNVKFDLTAKDEGWDMTRYLEVGRIEADQPEMRTGDDGTITVRGVPEGKMTWRIWLDDGQIYDSFQVSADTPNRLVIEMPE